MTAKFIVAGGQRTGSNFIEQALNSHDEIDCYGEVLLGIGGRKDPKLPAWLVRHRRLRLGTASLLSGALLTPSKVLDDVFASSSNTAVGCRVMYNQLRPRVRRYLTTNTDIRLIHLRRRNLVRQHLSRLQMHERHRVLGRPGAHATTKIEMPSLDVDPHKFLEGVKRIETDSKDFADHFGPRISCELWYEDLFVDGTLSDQVRTALGEALNVELGSVTSALVKTGFASLSDSIRNYAQLHTVLAATPYQWMLDDS